MNMSHKNSEKLNTSATDESADRQPLIRKLFANSLEYIAASMLIAICVVLFAGMFARYFLQIGLGWTEEAARYLQVWMTFIGAAVAVKRWGHFQLTIVNQWVPDRVQKPLQAFSIFIVCILALVMVVHGIDITKIGWEQTSPIMGWRIGQLYLVAPLSGTLMLIFCFIHLFNLMRGQSLPGHTLVLNQQLHSSESTKGMQS
ncbi:MAG: TRAP transporter small permease [Betaproteobacteria bacterium]|nr:TRAP transporter small permease [Betaproteobacteria bacterium]NBT69081.1 TRAP transporter small permease [Betaproteobacteria bacterium]NBY07644.1 TRAP transporter small permease [Betaproteobacteria bacterium]